MVPRTSGFYSLLYWCCWLPKKNSLHFVTTKTFIRSRQLSKSGLQFIILVDLISDWNMVMYALYEWLEIGVHGGLIRWVTAFSTKYEVDMIVSSLYWLQCFVCILSLFSDFLHFMTCFWCLLKFIRLFIKSSCII